MKIKDGATIAGLDIRMRRVLVAAAQLWEDAGQELVVTSGLDGAHSPGSLHYYGLALDFRTRYFTDEVAKSLSNQLQAMIGESYLVIFEGNHVHVQSRM